jgi:hypothetical protein
MEPMATERQIEANRRNAMKSCGPRTSEGKAKVAMNALKHGLLAQHVVLPNEDGDEFQEFSLGLEQQLLPVGELERMLVDSIAAYAWRLRRLVRVERGILIQAITSHAVEEVHAEIQDCEETRDHVAAEIHSVYAQQARDIGLLTDEAMAAALEKIVEVEDRLEAAEKRKKEAENVRDSADGILGTAFITYGEQTDVFAKLSRYEAHIQRSMFKALDELRRLQAARGNWESIRSNGPAASPSLELEEVNGDRTA